MIYAIHGYYEMLKKTLDKILDEKIELERRIENILFDAAYADRFLAKPNNRRCPSMYQLLETYYNKEDWGYHVQPKLRMRATPRQMTRYSQAIDILLMIDKSISDDPIFARKLMWLRANKIPWTKLGQMFAYHRVTIKNIYQTILEQIANKIRINIDNYDTIYI
jgi:hypothetical protein